MRLAAMKLIPILALLSMTSPLTAADEDRSDGPSRPRWAIAIHGGAGGDPEKWSAEKRAQREEGLRRALAHGRDLLDDGGDALDAVEQVIRILEDDSLFNAGRGAVLTSDGTVELDASIMNGKTLACGAVASVTNVRNPISLARRVMTETPHVLLVGQGAEAFAEAQGVELVDPQYYISWRAAGGANAEVAPSLQPDDPTHLGTVGCVALDAAGNLAAGTSTGGVAKKMPGRVGDSPIIGAGTYAANGQCAVSGTGVGEEFIRHAVAHDIAARLRYTDQSLEDACRTIIHEVLKPGIGGLIAVDHQGGIVLRHNTPGMNCGAADSNGRFDVYVKIDEQTPSAGK